jgi:hypothetical protein
VIRGNWKAVSEEARMSEAERRYLEGRQILNLYAFDGYGPKIALPE